MGSNMWLILVIVVCGVFCQSDVLHTQSISKVQVGGSKEAYGGLSALLDSFRNLNAKYSQELKEMTDAEMRMALRAGRIDVGVTYGRLTQEEFFDGDLIDFPVVTEVLAPAHSIRNAPPDGPDTPTVFGLTRLNALQLTVRDVCDIYLGNYTEWANITTQQLGRVSLFAVPINVVLPKTGSDLDVQLRQKLSFHCADFEAVVGASGAWPVGAEAGEDTVAGSVSSVSNSFGVDLLANIAATGARSADVASSSDFYSPYSYTAAFQAQVWAIENSNIVFAADEAVNPVPYVVLNVTVPSNNGHPFVMFTYAVIRKAPEPELFELSKFFLSAYSYMTTARALDKLLVPRGYHPVSPLVNVFFRYVPDVVRDRSGAGASELPLSALGLGDSMTLGMLQEEAASFAPGEKVLHIFVDTDTLLKPFRDEYVGDYLLHHDTSLIPQDSFTTAPVAIDSVVIIAQLGNVMRCRGRPNDATPLRFTLDVVADILTGNITQWDDPRIVNLNLDYAANLSTAGAIFVIGLNAPDEATTALLHALRKDNPSFPIDPVHEFSGITPGTLNMTDRLIQWNLFAELYISFGFSIFTWGFNDYALRNEMCRAEIAATGSAEFIVPTPDLLEAAAAKVSAPAPGTTRDISAPEYAPDFLMLEPGAYPITLVVYATMHARSDHIYHDRYYSLVVEFLYGMATSETLAKATREAGLGALPSSMRLDAAESLARVAGADGAPLLSVATCLNAGVVCSDRGVCVSGECRCDSGFEGATCEREAGSDSDSLSDQVIGAIVASVSGVGLLLLLLCCAVASVVVCLVVCLLCVVCCVAVVAVAVVVVVAMAVSVVSAGGAGTGGIMLLRARKVRREATRSLEEALDIAGDLEIHGKYRELNYDDLVFLQKIGEGAFGQVFRGTWNGAEVAIKTIDINTASEEAVDEARREAEIMTALGNHPNVITFVGAVTEGRQFCLVAEFCPNGSLYDLLVTKNTTFDALQMVCMAKDAASGIAYLHSQDVVHRDIAMRNSLVGDRFQVLISDFGTARLCETAEVASSTKSTVGPVRWMAPEAIADKQYSAASDAWSFGVMLWEMITRRQPYEGMSVFDVGTGVVRQGLRLEIPADCDPTFKRVMKGVWKDEPEKRMTMKKVTKLLRERCVELGGENADVYNTKSGVRDPYVTSGGYSAGGETVASVESSYVDTRTIPTGDGDEYVDSSQLAV